jgi:hypothetical protein
LINLVMLIPIWLFYIGMFVLRSRIVLANTTQKPRIDIWRISISSSRATVLCSGEQNEISLRESNAACPSVLE